MKLFEREDIRFVERGVDASQREAAVGDLIRKRRLLFWCAVATTLCAAGVSFAGHDSGGGAALGLAAGIHWILVFKYESELRLLMMIRRLKSL